jgi:hypothetical protein
MYAYLRRDEVLTELETRFRTLHTDPITESPVPESNYPELSQASFRRPSLLEEVTDEGSNIINRNQLNSFFSDIITACAKHRSVMSYNSIGYFNKLFEYLNSQISRNENFEDCIPRLAALAQYFLIDDASDFFSPSGGQRRIYKGSMCFSQSEDLSQRLLQLGIKTYPVVAEILSNSNRERIAGKHIFPVLAYKIRESTGSIGDPIFISLHGSVPICIPDTAGGIAYDPSEDLKITRFADSTEYTKFEATCLMIAHYSSQEKYRYLYNFNPSLKFISPESTFMSLYSRHDRYEFGYNKTPVSFLSKATGLLTNQYIAAYMIIEKPSERQRRDPLFTTTDSSERFSITLQTKRTLQSRKQNTSFKEMSFASQEILSGERSINEFLPKSIFYNDDLIYFLKNYERFHPVLALLFPGIAQHKTQWLQPVYERSGYRIDSSYP